MTRMPPRTQARRNDQARGRFDPWLLLVIATLVVFGVIMVASASIAVADGRHYGAFFYLKRHLLFLAMGLAVAWGLSRIELQLWERYSLVLVLLAVISLGLVFIPHLGMRINGAQRWVNLGVTGFQPVEAVKLAVILYVASYLVRHRQAVERDLLGVLRPISVTLVLVVLLLLQPDFGSAVLLLAVVVGMIWLGGARMRNLLYLALPLVPLFTWVALSQDYRIRRLTSFLDPWKDPFSNGFQLTQALIAVGRGHWFGVGLGDSVQKLFYLPEAHTDFILAVIAEELGFAGILLVVAMFTLLVGRALWLGMLGLQLGQRYAAFVAFGVALMIGLQSTVSIGVNLGMLPTKGLTLPLISSGGSSVIMTLAMLGLLLRAGYEIRRAEDARRISARSEILKEVSVGVSS